MKTAAVITEFNPFHRGHAYFLNEVRARSGADVLIAVMSGDFVQRGEPAVIDKYARTEAALKGGCDLVIELPVRYSLSSAGGFAQGSVRILNALGIVDELWFGSECGDIDCIQNAAGILEEEPPAFRAALQESLKNGLPYPAARAHALSEVSDTDVSLLLDGPNNILGTEYCVAAKRLCSGFKLRTLQRVGGAYNDASPDNAYPSALAIRKILSESRTEKENDRVPDSAAEYLPEYSADILRRSSCFLFPDDFSDILRIRLLEENPESLCGYLNVTPDLAKRIKNLEKDYLSFTDFTARIKSRNYTYSHVSRALISIVLKLRASAPADPGAKHYVRLLGMKKNAEAVLRSIHDKGTAELVSSPARFPKGLFEEDLYASSLYESIRSVRFQSPFIHESSRKFLKI